MNSDTRKSSDSVTRESVDNQKARAERREFLKKAGRFAVYTPPSVMLLMQPSRTAVAGSACGNSSGGTTSGTGPTEQDVLKAILDRFNGANY